MISFKEFLSEARRNPNDNPRVSVYDKLKQYKDRDDIYITFTDINKVGIKPMSDFNTPNGIYTYPLKEIWEEYNIDNNTDIGSEVPFAGDRKFIQIIQLINDDGFINDMYVDYTEIDYNKDIENIENIIKSKSQYKDKDNDFLDEIVGNALNESINDSPIGRLWYITWKISKNVNMFEFLGSHSNTQRWNNILRQLGYTGFADKSGKGIIHSSEPLQAVFLSTQPIKLIDTIDNIITNYNSKIKDAIQTDNYDLFNRYIKISPESSNLELLNYAIYKKKEKFVKIILDSGAIPDSNSLYYAIYIKNSNILDDVISICKSSNIKLNAKVLSLVISMDDEKLLDKIIQLNVTFNDYTLLEAVNVGNINIFEKLMRLNVKIPDDLLSAIIHNNNLDIFNKAVELGIKPDVKSLNTAIVVQNIDMIKTVIKLGGEYTDATLDLVEEFNNKEIKNIIMKYIGGKS